MTFCDPTAGLVKWGGMQTLTDVRTERHEDLNSYLLSTCKSGFNIYRTTKKTYIQAE